MPAITMHDVFGRETLLRNPRIIGDSTDEHDAFLLGNQGPDPLFFLRLTPHLAHESKLGTAMHERNTAKLIYMLKTAIDVAPDQYRDTARAYALGFLGHYSLDSAAHPLIFSTQYALCDAGVDGLSRKDGSEVHAYIERELDEWALWTRVHETVQTFKPWRRMLLATDRALDAISDMYSFLSLAVYGHHFPKGAFTQAVHDYRRLEHLLYSPHAGKLLVLSSIERTVRSHSMYNAASMRDAKRTKTQFGNDERNPWENPFTGAISTASFSDLFERAQSAMMVRVNTFLSSNFSFEDAGALTQNINLDGKPTEGVLLAVDDA